MRSPITAATHLRAVAAAAGGACGAIGVGQAAVVRGGGGESPGDAIERMTVRRA